MLLDLHATCHIRDTYTQHERLTPTHEYTEITFSFNAIYLVAHQTMLYKKISRLGMNDVLTNTNQYETAENAVFRNTRGAHKYQ